MKEIARELAMMVFEQANRDIKNGRHPDDVYDEIQEQLDSLIITVKSLVYQMAEEQANELKN